jgi:RNA polymerase sigma factor (sigma-70 family)
MPFCSDGSEKPKGAYNMTLKELLERVEPTLGNPVPRAATLKYCGSPLVAEKTMGDRSRLRVYQNGFALYEADRRCTVFRTDYCGGYIYFSRTEQIPLTEEYFAEAEWWVRLLLEGEDRMTHSRNVSVEHHEISMDCGLDEMELQLHGAASLAEELTGKEQLEEIFARLTRRQQEVVRKYYIDGYGVQEIAKDYGISHQAVSVTLSDVRKKLKKYKRI